MCDKHPLSWHLHRLLALASTLRQYVHLLKLIAPSVDKTLPELHIYCLVWAKQHPVSVVLGSAHEPVGDPTTVEEVAHALLFLAMVFLCATD